MHNGIMVGDNYNMQISYERSWYAQYTIGKQCEVKV